MRDALKREVVRLCGETEDHELFCLAVLFVLLAGKRSSERGYENVERLCLDFSRGMSEIVGTPFPGSGETIQ